MFANVLGDKGFRRIFADVLTLVIIRKCTVSPIEGIGDVEAKKLIFFCLTSMRTLSLRIRTQCSFRDERCLVFWSWFYDVLLPRNNCCFSQSKIFIDLKVFCQRAQLKLNVYYIIAFPHVCKTIYIYAITCTYVCTTTKYIIYLFFFKACEIIFDIDIKWNKREIILYRQCNYELS